MNSIRVLHISFFTLALLLPSYSFTAAQTHGEGHHLAHIIGLDVGHTHVFEEDTRGHRGLLSLPSFGINYTLQINAHWGIGIHTDLIFEEYHIVREVHGAEEEEIERSYPLAPALLGLYKLNGHWSLLGGIGREFASGKNFWLNRAGIEYSHPFLSHWELFGTLQYDVKWHAYDNWVLGFGVARHI